ncbi:MAG: cytochrome P450 [Ktedonobacteraceae bacterium]|nr:cytochrome P450 [Ktedonobacteraceae bacterium]
MATGTLLPTTKSIPTRKELPLLGSAIPFSTRNAYLPFGIGAHICVGNHFAMLEAHLLIATISQHVSLELLTKEAIQPDASQGLALRTDRKVMMKIHKF